MSKQANPTTVGLFVIIGLALAVAGVILFGSARWFSRSEEFIMYFNSSVKGLNPGAAVKFRGVNIGSVVDVMLQFNQAPDDTAIPVLIAIDDQLVDRKSDRTIDFHSEASFKSYLDRGLRATLKADSLVTGLLYVDLDLIPDAPPPVFHEQGRAYKEIPTIPGQIDELLANLARVDVKGLVDKVNALLDRADRALGQLEVGKISAGITNVLAAVNRILKTPQLTNTLMAAHGAFDDIRVTSTELRRQVLPMARSVTNTLDDVRLTIAELRAGVQDLRDTLAPDAPLRHDLGMALEQLAAAAQSVSSLAEFLNRNPNALISGRQQPERKP